MGKVLNNQAAEMEADKIAMQFVHSNDVVKDMSAAYNADFSSIKFHTDSAADEKVRAADRDAIASGTDIFFGKGILESNNSASKGLLAHELAHTMQQGIVASDGAVSETVSAGVEQGGRIGDWFKRLFSSKAREEHRREKIKNLDIQFADQEHIDSIVPEMSTYGQIMPELQKLDKFGMSLGGDDNFTTNVRPNAMKAVGDMESISLTEEEIQKMADLSIKAKENANEKLANMEWDNSHLSESVVLQAFGHRITADGTGALDKNLRKKVFNNSMQKYANYMKALDAQGMDYVSESEGLEYIEVMDKPYAFGNKTSQISEDLLNIIASHFGTQAGQEYLYHFYQNYKDADIFTEGKSSLMSYILQTVITGEGASLVSARAQNGLKNPDAKTLDARDNVFKEAGRSFVLLPTISKMSEEERKALPIPAQMLHQKYLQLEEQLRQQVLNYKGA